MGLNYPLIWIYLYFVYRIFTFFCPPSNKLKLQKLNKVNINKLKANLFY